MIELKLPWVEKYRPDTLENVILQPSLHKTITGIIAGGADTLPNLLFSGPPGCGKTTLAKVIAKELDLSCLYINASEENGVDMIRSKMIGFCTTMSLDGKIKLVILDEAEGLSAVAQGALKNLIESVASSTRFVFTCNAPDKILPAIKSRLKEIPFKPVDKKIVTKRVIDILKAEGIKVSQEQGPKLVTLIDRNYPDIRKIINHLQYFSSCGELEIDFDELVTEDVYQSFIQMVKRKKLSELRELMRNNKMDYESMIKMIFNDVLNDTELSKDMPEGKRAEVIILCAEYVHRSLNFVIDKEINFADFAINLMRTL